MLTPYITPVKTDVELLQQVRILDQYHPQSIYTWLESALEKRQGDLALFGIHFFRDKTDADFTEYKNRATEIYLENTLGEVVNASKQPNSTSLEHAYKSLKDANEESDTYDFSQEMQHYSELIVNSTIGAIGDFLSQDLSLIMLVKRIVDDGNYPQFDSHALLKKAYEAALEKDLNFLKHSVEIHDPDGASTLIYFIRDYSRRLGIDSEHQIDEICPEPLKVQFAEELKCDYGEYSQFGVFVLTGEKPEDNSYLIGQAKQRLSSEHTMLTVYHHYENVMKDLILGRAFAEAAGDLALGDKWGEIFSDYLGFDVYNPLNG